MVDFRLINNIENLRNEGASWAAISRQIINPQTGRHYDYRTVRNWIERGQEPYQHSQKKLVQRTATLRRNVQSDKPTKRTLKFRKKLGLKPKKKRVIIGGGWTPEPIDFGPSYPEIQDDDLMEYAAGEMGPFGSFYDGVLPRIEAQHGHIKITILQRYIWYHSEGIKRWDEIRSFTTTNNYNYPHHAAEEMQLILNKMWGKWNGKEGTTGSPKPRIYEMILADNLEGENEDGNSISGGGEFWWVKGDY